MKVPGQDSHGLSSMIECVAGASSWGRHIGQVVVVLITDGRANVPLRMSEQHGSAAHDDTRASLGAYDTLLQYRCCSWQ